MLRGCQARVARLVEARFLAGDFRVGCFLSVRALLADACFGGALFAPTLLAVVFLVGALAFFLADLRVRVLSAVRRGVFAFFAVFRFFVFFGIVSSRIAS